MKTPENLRSSGSVRDWKSTGNEKLCSTFIFSIRAFSRSFSAKERNHRALSTRYYVSLMKQERIMGHGPDMGSMLGFTPLGEANMGV